MHEGSRPHSALQVIIVYANITKEAPNLRRRIEFTFAQMKGKPPDKQLRIQFSM